MTRRRWFGLGLAALPAAVLVAMVLGLVFSLPTYDEVKADYRASDLVILDRRGEILHEVRVDPQRRRLQWTDLADISPSLPPVVLQAEDRRFHEHSGIDWRALSAAAWQRLRWGRERGASTVTMQLAGFFDERLAPRSGRRSATQKLRQLASAAALESFWSKSEILEAYLNLVSFRGELQGIRAASRGLFRKDPHGLTGAESVVLAALIRSPEAPPSQVGARAILLAGQLDPTPAEGELKRALGALDQPYRVRDQASLAPHAARLLTAAHPDITVGGLATTLDLTIQAEVQAQLQRKLLELEHRNVRDAAALVVELGTGQRWTGQVRAYVANGGSVSSARHVDGIRAPRQAGSTLKPFLYGLAFDLGILTPATMLDDSPVNLMVSGGIYRPGNYDHRFRGPVTARTALASSLNIPAVRVLELVGTERFLSSLEALGLRSLREPEYYGPSLALGAADVTLWDLVSAYLALAQGGRAAEPEIEAGSGSPGRAVLSPEASFLISDILSDREARSTTFSLESPLATPFWTAVKTGTSKDMRDNWCIGYSSRYVVGVWVGNFSGEPMWEVSGVTGAAPLWLEIMTWLHRSEPSIRPVPPDGVERAAVHFSHSQRESVEWFRRGSAPSRVRRIDHVVRHRIVYPPEGTIVAVDPDIPPRFQAVFFEALPSDGKAVWELDGRSMGKASGLVPWFPESGEHRLRLVSLTGEALDEVRFFVRGLAAGEPVTGLE